ncbi:MAG: riboflavin synthase [Dehalococcoidia bacterium]|nr:riboflavin synthase [Dehalococcoidia bacterium]
MFTGIVEELGHVVGWRPPVMTIEGNATLEGAKIGDSISVNGVCLTVTSLRGKRFTVDVSPETVRRSNLGRLAAGSPVNLERPLAYGGRMGGHLVEGHVDAVGSIVAVEPEKESFIFTFEAPRSLCRYIVEKGFVAVDGISLTVVSERPPRFTAAVIPYTYEHTTLGMYRPGSSVNLEVDILAKYVERLLGDRAKPKAARRGRAKARR